MAFTLSSGERGNVIFLSMPLLQVFVVSTRKARSGPAVAQWFLERARQSKKFDVELVDLQAVNLPLLDEPNHPRLRQYQHAHTKAWSATVSRADAFVFVTPEYNFSAPPSLINAPEGCKFRPRCPHAFDKCMQEPGLENRVETPGHLDRCWLDVDFKREHRDETISGEPVEAA